MPLNKNDAKSLLQGLKPLAYRRLGDGVCHRCLGKASELYHIAEQFQRFYVHIDVVICSQDMGQA
jgi:hypothetical protein